MAKILLVDDSVVSRFAVARFLEKSGHIITEAKHGAEALEAIELEIPDLVISDVEMPVMDGIELLNTLQRDFPSLPVVSMSGSDSAETHCIAAGAAAFFPKPVDLQRLATMVDMLPVEVSTFCHSR